MYLYTLLVEISHFTPAIEVWEEMEHLHHCPQRDNTFTTLQFVFLCGVYVCVCVCGGCYEILKYTFSTMCGCPHETFHFI